MRVIQQEIEPAVECERLESDPVAGKRRIQPIGAAEGAGDEGIGIMAGWNQPQEPIEVHSTIVELVAKNGSRFPERFISCIHTDHRTINPNGLPHNRAMDRLFVRLYCCVDGGLYRPAIDRAIDHAW